jgi:hypothetical protein
MKLTVSSSTAVYGFLFLVWHMYGKNSILNIDSLGVGCFAHKAQKRDRDSVEDAQRG